MAKHRFMPVADAYPPLDQSRGIIVGNQGRQLESGRAGKGLSKLLGLVSQGAGEIEFIQAPGPLTIGEIVLAGHQERRFPGCQHSLVDGVHGESSPVVIEGGSIGHGLLQVKPRPDQAPSTIHQESGGFDGRQRGRVDRRHPDKNVHRSREDPMSRLEFVGVDGVEWPAKQNGMLDYANIHKVDVQAPRQVGRQGLKDRRVHFTLGDDHQVVVIEGAPFVRPNRHDSTLSSSETSDQQDGLPWRLGDGCLKRLDNPGQVTGNMRLRGGRGQGGEELRQGSPPLGA